MYPLSCTTHVLLCAFLRVFNIISSEKKKNVMQGKYQTSKNYHVRQIDDFSNDGAMFELWPVGFMLLFYSAASSVKCHKHIETGFLPQCKKGFIM